MRNIAVLGGFLIATFLAAAIGGVFTAPAVRQWYPTLRKPPWTPPAWLFGPVWTALYLCIAAAGYLAWRQAGFAARWVFVLFAIQLALNAAWSILFFGFRQIGWGFVELTALWLAIAATTAGLFTISPWSGVLFLPYLIWVTFAGCLNFAIWKLNAATISGAG